MGALPAPASTVHGVRVPLTGSAESQPQVPQHTHRAPPRPSLGVASPSPRDCRSHALRVALRTRGARRTRIVGAESGHLLWPRLLASGIKSRPFVRGGAKSSPQRHGNGITMSSKSAVVLGYWDIRGVSAVSPAELLGEKDGRGGGRGLRIRGLAKKGEPSLSLRGGATSPAEPPGRGSRLPPRSWDPGPRRGGLRTANRRGRPRGCLTTNSAGCTVSAAPGRGTLARGVGWGSEVSRRRHGAVSSSWHTPSACFWSSPIQPTRRNGTRAGKVRPPLVPVRRCAPPS